MRNGRNGRLLLVLVLPVLLGLVGMHALVVPAPTTATSPTVARIPVEHATPQHGPVVPAGGAGEHGAPAGHDDHHDDGASHLMHLCLAVLAAVGVALLSAWLFLGRLSLPGSSTPVRRWTGGMPAARPPPVPRRLAQLCVLRN
ncbi:DUF6153 family protein [Pseudonocardia nantongensis]|uniref:DUF6153 family protein n=1 Tax=Pseudonocardia nantongensis TaxID=1181885 RepID=UPI00397A25E4